MPKQTTEQDFRDFVRLVLEDSHVIDEDDEQEGDEKDEVSVSANVGGVTTPLGTGPTYPNPTRRKRVPAYVAAGKAFGDAKLAKKKRKKK